METLAAFLPGLLRMSGQASILVVLVLAVQWLCGPRLKPRWRYLLWVLVALRLALPWTIPLPAGVLNEFKWRAAAQPVASPSDFSTVIDTPVSKVEAAAVTLSSANHHPLLWAWLAGIFCLAACSLLTQFKLYRRIVRERPFIHEPTLHLLEECKDLMGVHTPVMLIETNAIESPGLFGFVRPRLLLPAKFVSNFTRDELRHVFLHELAHIKRCDILMGWFTLVLQAIHWFNPLVWLAFHRMRVDRELACDALALSCAQAGENESYGLTIIKLLDDFGQSRWRPGLAGILENKQQMKERISMIAKFRKTERGLVLAVFVLSGLMLVTLTLSCGQSPKTLPAAQPPDPAPTQAVKVSEDEQGPPQIVSTSPQVGETDVDPATAEITVTFDRDMGTGFSWTGGGPNFPPGVDGKNPYWKDLRTCVFPVRLEAARYYRVGINSKSYQSFESAAGVPAQPSAIYFTTQGASAALRHMAATPQIVGLNPRNGTMDVDPKLAEIRVTFNVVMGDGCSWTGGGSDFPKIPDGKRPYWTADHLTCVLPVELQPGQTYHFGLNSPSHQNFQSTGGVPLEPVYVTFKTRD